MRIAPNTRSPTRTQGEISCRITHSAIVHSACPRSSIKVALKVDLRAQERLISSSAPPRADVKPERSDPNPRRLLERDPDGFGVAIAAVAAATTTSTVAVTLPPCRSVTFTVAP